LKVLHGTAPLQELDAETTLGLLHRCAANEDDHHALRTFTPLISRGFLGLLHHPPTKRRELAQTIALQVTVHPERLEQIASHIAPLVSVKPGSAIEALALSQANRRPVHRLAGSYSKNLWLGVIAFIGAAAAGLVLMAYGARRTLEERGKALAIPRSAALQAPTRVSAPAP
jgi:hypothetical protein